MKNVLVGERLEVQFVRSVIVGTNCFRIGIYHDRLHPFLTQGKGGVNTAVIKFDTLTDSVGTAPQDHHFAYLVRL